MYCNFTHPESIDKNVIERACLIDAMNTIIKACNDETAYYNRWIYTVPDESTFEDMIDIAEDRELFLDTCECFRKIMQDEYIHSGLYAGGWTDFKTCAEIMEEKLKAIEGRNNY